VDLGSFYDGQSLTISDQSNIGATNDGAGGPYCHGTPEKGVWYKLSIAFPAEVTVSTCDQANFDTVVAVYSGSCGSLVCTDRFVYTSQCDWITRFNDNVTSQNVYIWVGGVQGLLRTSGIFKLTVSVSATELLPPVS